jgi:hypothetical protein
MKCPGCGAELPTYARGEPHLLHTDAEFKAAWDLTDGRFQVFVYPPEPGDPAFGEEAICDTRSKYLFGCDRKIVEVLVPVIQRWLDEQAAKASTP